MALQQEIGELRSRLQQREAALTRLNTRLRRLEQGLAPENLRIQEELARKENELSVVNADVHAARSELEALRATKTFRYTGALRHAYRRLVLRRTTR